MVEMATAVVPQLTASTFEVTPQPFDEHAQPKAARPSNVDSARQKRTTEHRAPPSVETELPAGGDGVARRFV
jgi:hypothetical protein